MTTKPSTDGGKKDEWKTPSFEMPPSPKHPLFLVDIASIIRSKNSGPHELTIDILFSLPSIYHLIKASGILTVEIVSSLYDISADEMIWCAFFDPALAFKATFPGKRGGRSMSSGGFLESDMRGSQRYMELMEVPLWEELVGELWRVLERGVWRRRGKEKEEWDERDDLIVIEDEIPQSGDGESKLGRRRNFPLCPLFQTVRWWISQIISSRVVVKYAESQ